MTQASAIGLALAAVGALAAMAGLREPRVDRLDNPAFSERGGILYYRDQPFTGIEIVRYPDNTVYSETRYREGIMEGVRDEYATTGSLRRRWRYKQGKKDGLQEGWYVEGPKLFEQSYDDGILNGVVTEWHQNGKIFNQQTYEHGVETARKILYPTSEIYSNYVRRSDRKYGIDNGGLCFEVKREGEL